MSYDFTSYTNRFGKDAYAVDAVLGRSSGWGFEPRRPKEGFDFIPGERWKDTRHLPGCLSSGSIKRMMFGGTNRREHCGLGRGEPSTHEAASGHKKSRTLLIRVREGPAKNLLIGRKETSSKQDT